MRFLIKGLKRAGAAIGIVAASMIATAPAATAQTAAPALDDAWAQIELTAEAPFASEIYTFYVQDEQQPPLACRTVFVGSSSIRFWLSLSEDFPDLDPLNRGFGGSQVSHVIGYFDRLLTPHAPQEIVFYAGENDLNAGASPSDVLARFQTFMALKDDRVGNAPVYFLSIKPSIARIDQLAAQAEANALIADYADTRADLTFIGVSAAMLDADGAPKPIFISDRLHMNPAGYAIWTQILKPVLSDPMRPKRDGC